jgi:hypothetical protein
MIGIKTDERVAFYYVTPEFNKIYPQTLAIAGRTSPSVSG